MKKAEAIAGLRPGAEFVLRGDDLEWLDQTQAAPSEQEIQDYMVANDYSQKRAQAYPAIGDQLDALWKGGDAADAMKQRIFSVKAQYPKNEGGQ